MGSGEGQWVGGGLKLLFSLTDPGGHLLFHLSLILPDKQYQ
jgi:hypothetical protein